MFQRVFWGLLIALAAVLVLVVEHAWVRVLLLLLLMLLSQHEMLKALRHAGWQPYAWPGYVFALASLPLHLYLGLDAAWLLMIGLVMAVFCQFVLTAHQKKQPDMMEAFTALLPLVYPLSFFQIVLRSAMLPAPYWRCVLVGGIAVACVTDTAALFGGMALGKHKLAPAISPQKTWEGAISGFVGGMLSGVALCFLQGVWGGALPLWLYLLAAAAASVAGQLGDLTASGIKRYADIKDFGKLIPGHGGVLDRLDSILFAVPVFYFCISLYAGV